MTDTILAAVRMLVTGDPALWNIVGVSFLVSISALLLAIVPALALAALLAFGRFPGRRFMISIFNSMLSIPAVVVGLTFYLLLSRHGPLGDWRLLFTQEAMILGQIALSLPIIVAMTHTALQELDPRAWETCRTLGAGYLRATLTLMSEVRYALLAAVIAAFGRIIAEVGSAMMLGGNILSYTRNITTAIALETSKGAFAQGIALGAVLVMMAFTLNAGLHWLQGRSRLQPEYLA
jgi:tungstate transport system permease protein